MHIFLIEVIMIACTVCLHAYVLLCVCVCLSVCVCETNDQFFNCKIPSCDPSIYLLNDVNDHQKVIPPI